MNTQDGALYRLLTLRPASYPGRDGVNLVAEALDDVSFQRDVAKAMLAGLHDGSPDHAELGRIVWERIQCYAEGLPSFDDALVAESEPEFLRARGAI